MGFVVEQVFGRGEMTFLGVRLSESERGVYM